MGEAVYFLVVTARSLVSLLAPAAAAVVVVVVVAVAAAAVAVVVAYEPGAVPAGPAPRAEGPFPICARTPTPGT